MTHLSTVLVGKSRLIAGGGPALAMARERMPGFTEARELLDRLLTFTVPNPETTDAGAEMTARILDSARKGKPMPTDILAVAAASTAQQTAHGVAVQALDAAMQSVASDLQIILMSNTDLIWSALHEALAPIVDEARSIWPWPSDADDAIRLDKVKEYQRAAELDGAYRRARTDYAAAMKELDNRALPGTQAASAWIGYFIANPLEVWPHLVRYETGHKYPEPGREKRYPNSGRPPWPDNMHTGGLKWLAANPNAKAWAPTPAEFAALLSEVGNEKRDHLANIPRRPTPIGAHSMRAESFVSFPA